MLKRGKVLSIAERRWRMYAGALFLPDDPPSSVMKEAENLQADEYVLFLSLSPILTLSFHFKYV